MGLGSLSTFTLAEARDRAKVQRQLLADGTDPLASKRDSRLARQIAAANVITFDDACAAYIKAHSPGWKSVKHGDQWRNTLATYASPVFGKLPVSDVNTALVMRVLEPMWGGKTETATRVRGRIEKILDWSKVHGYRTGENPARWKGHLENSLVAPGKVMKVVHHPALPIAEMGNFMMALRQRDGTAAKALEFAVLTAARSGEVRGATWGELDLVAKVWTIPAERMKAGLQHRVPLSLSSIAVLNRDSNQNHEPTDLVFPAPRGGVMSDMTLTALTRRMGVKAVPHGFRSTFRDWCAENTNFPRDLAEMALAHKLESKVEAAYLRSDNLEKRRVMMQSWADFCNPIKIKANVIKFKGVAA